MSSSQGALPEMVPEWLVNIAALSWRVLATVALAAVLVGVALLLSTVTASIVISIIAAAAFSPYLVGLRERGWSRGGAAAAMTGVVVLVIVGLIGLALVAFVPFWPRLVDSIAGGLNAIREAMASAGVSDPSSDAIAQLASQVKSWLATTVGSIVATLGTWFSIAILSLFTTFYLLLDGDKAWAWAIGMTPAAKHDELTAAGRDALHRIGRYFRGAAIVAAIDALSSLAFLVLLNVPLAGPLAILVFLLGFIPYFGALIAAAVLVLATWATSGPAAAAILVGLLVAVRLLQARYLSPITAGRNASIPPALVLVALPIGASLAGLAGVFIVIPIVAMFVAVNGAVLSALDPGPAEQRDSLVPGWLDRLAQWSWRLLVAFAVVGLAVAAITSVPILLIPALFGTFLAATLAPAFGALLRRGQNMTVAAGLATGGTFILVIGIAALSVASLAREAGAIGDAAVSGASAIVGGTSLDWLATVAGSFSGAIVGIAGSVLDGLIGMVVALALTALLCFFFLRDGGQIWGWALSRLPEGPRDDIDLAGTQASGILSGYMVGTAAISAFGAATQFVIMAILGIPLALPLAVLSFFGGFIPYIGSLITTSIALLVTIAVGDPTDIAVMIIFTVVFNIVQGNFVAPLVYGKAVNLHPAIVLLSIPAGGAIAGIMGMLLIVPLLGVVATTWRTVLAAFASEADEADEPVVASPVELADQPPPELTIPAS
ncbi:MAG TPA: AI-2E family transporter [Candidatus Limnocylindrales bacterium]|nr:AI-2E family transporter [Candidatus Limnocylindrales bacterium]